VLPPRKARHRLPPRAAPRPPRWPQTPWAPHRPWPNCRLSSLAFGGRPARARPNKRARRRTQPGPAGKGSFEASQEQRRRAPRQTFHFRTSSRASRRRTFRRRCFFVDVFSSTVFFCRRCSTVFFLNWVFRQPRDCAAPKPGRCWLHPVPPRPKNPSVAATLPPPPNPVPCRRRPARTGWR